jgi:maleylacetoacetate isomerase
MAEMVLYDYWRSSASYRVRIGLNLLDQPFRAVSIDLNTGAQFEGANMARNPQGLVPSLDTGDDLLTQSLAILEYLDETSSAGWLPQSPAARAHVRAIAYAIAMDIHPVCNLRVAKYAVSQGAKMEGWMQHFIALGLEGVEALIFLHANGQFCWGNSVTLADICLVPQMYNARRWGVDLAPFPTIARIDAALTALPAFAAAHPDHFAPKG